jgi:hypothetical protein
MTTRTYNIFGQNLVGLTGRRRLGVNLGSEHMSIIFTSTHVYDYFYSFGVRGHSRPWTFAAGFERRSDLGGFNKRCLGYLKHTIQMTFCCSWRVDSMLE